MTRNLPGRLCSDADDSVAMVSYFSLPVCEKAYLLLVNINEYHASREVKHCNNAFSILWFD